MELGNEILLDGHVKGWITYNPFNKDEKILGYLFINPFTGNLTWQERFELNSYRPERTSEEDTEMCMRCSEPDNERSGDRQK